MNTEQLVQRLADQTNKAVVAEGHQIGIEKESLRVDTHGALAYTPHPAALGAALTHPYVTTDYSEMLLEIIVPPQKDNINAVTFLNNLHIYTHHHLDNEILWSNSMPCVTKNDVTIPLAQYGCSNIGRMKTIYRSGLGHRYGRSMQTISGIHFNYSFNPQLWSCLAEIFGRDTAPETLRSEYSMGVIRNLMRISWLITYLFGASPAVCKSFVGSARNLQVFDDCSLYGPYATSLRMGDIGYQNNLEAKMDITPSYDSLEEYITSLRRAVTTPCEQYKKIGVLVNGEYRQLNANILQIENEHYATVRPKCVARKNEMRLLGLHRAGVEYIELRALDLNAFDPVGLDVRQLDFLEALFWLALLQPSPPMNADEQKEVHYNEMLVAHQGRKPGLRLLHNTAGRNLAEWGDTICKTIQPIVELLDTARGGNRYRAALATQQYLFAEPDATPSARVLDEMRTNHESFAAMTLRKSHEFHRDFLAQSLPDEQLKQWRRLVDESIAQQQATEQRETLPLDDFIKNYFAQLNTLPQ